MPNRGLFFRLEERGPTGELHPQTSNRAELRAAIAALECRSWSVEEGWRRVFIVTDSTYVAKGATVWIETWKERGWLNAKGLPIANEDLWRRLLKLVNKHAEEGCEIAFWLIGRELNKVADGYAKYAADLHMRNGYDKKIHTGA